MDCVESADLKCSSSTESRRFHNALCSQCNGKTRSKNSIRRFPSNFSDIMLREFRKKQIITIIINRLNFYLLKKKKDKDRREKREEQERRDFSLPPFLFAPKKPRWFTVWRNDTRLPPRDDPLGAKRPWARTDPRAWRRIGRVLWRSFPRGPGDSSCTCAGNSVHRPPRSIRVSQPGSRRPTVSSATGGTSSPSGTSGSKGRGRPATRAPVWSRSGSLGRPTRTISADPGTANGWT